MQLPAGVVKLVKHSGLKIRRRKPCGFESRLRHFGCGYTASRTIGVPGAARTVGLGGASP